MDLTTCLLYVTCALQVVVAAFGVYAALESRRTFRLLKQAREAREKAAKLQYSANIRPHLYRQFHEATA